MFDKPLFCKRPIAVEREQGGTGASSVVVVVARNQLN